ncbi:Double-stranded RNA-binding protein Staufen [Nymphon striatum]|nr:Double-stranded RNA-binding protein Staufen [Nymphon striatum]
MNTENVNITTSKAYGSGAYSNGSQLVTQSMSSGNITTTSQSSTPLGFENETMANTKEKTPMCLMNELARYNKLTLQYRLINESGPAHKKTFTVRLDLGPDEKYEASGQSIKKAQHAAARVGLAQTMYRHPPPKFRRRSHRSVGETSDPAAGCNVFQGAVTPTVELNALAMKRSEHTIYQVLEAPVTSSGYHPGTNHARSNFHVPPNFNFRGIYHQNMSHHHYGNSRYPPPMRPNTCCVSLRVGNREFLGEGKTVQAARHNAASKALVILRNLPFPEFPGASEVAENTTESKLVKNELLDDSAELKSPISLVHEVALKRNLTVTFEVVQESGPAHMRTFITRCIVGEYSTEGEGNGKKVSKKRAAEKMLDELKKLPPISITTSQKCKSKMPAVKKKSRNLIKEQKAHPEYGQNINPISRLIQIQQAKKEKDPVYTLLAEDGMPRRRHFVIEVAVGDKKCNGKGPNKKLAKRAAAEEMLRLMGYSKIQKQPGKPAIKAPGSEAINDEKPRKVKFVDHDESDPRLMDDMKNFTGCQLAPGLIRMHTDNSQNENSVSCVDVANPHNMNDIPSSPSLLSNESMQAMAKELLHKDSVMIAESARKSGSVSTASKSTFSPKQNLLYLADILNFNVSFSEFPQRKGTEYISLVSISTQPPEVFHGSGETVEESDNQAAIKVLQMLSKSGLDHVGGTKMSLNATSPADIGNFNDPLVHSTNQKITNSVNPRHQSDYSSNDVKSKMMKPDNSS